VSKIQNIERVRLLLQNGPAKAAALLEALNISQPTFSRLWSDVPDGVVLGASKARQYALRRQVSGVDAPIPVFRVATNGLITPIGHLDVLPQDDVITVELLDLFGALIGNTDKHHGNIAVRWTLERQHRLLEAYDKLPMLYRPNVHGEIVERAWKPDYLGNVALRHLSRCHGMALEFWHDVLQDTRISVDFKTVANNHLRAIQPLATA